MKKLFSYVLALTLLVSTMSVAFAAPKVSDDVENKYQKKAVDVLTALKVVNGKSDGKFHADDSITRAEMATILVRAIGEENLAKAYKADIKSGKMKPDYTDIQNHWAAGYIQVLAGSSITKGVGGGMFNPEGKIDYAQAITFIVRTLNYTDEVVVKDNWATSYVRKGRELKVIGRDKHVEYESGFAPRGDVALMLYNALDVSMRPTIQNGGLHADGSRNLDFGQRDTLLELLTGSSKDNELISYDGNTDFDILPHVGMYGKKFYDESTGKLLVAVDKSVKLMGDFNTKTAADVATFKTTDGTTYYVNPSLLTHYKKDSDGKDVAKNTVPKFVNYQGPTDTDLKTDIKANNKNYILSVRVVGKTIKHIYSYSRLTPKNGFTFNGDRDAKNIEKNFKIREYKFDKDSEGNLNENSFELLGVEKLSDIKKDDVVHVYVTGNDSIRRMEVGTKVLKNVKCTKVNSDADTFTIDGKEYGKSAATTQSMPQAGETVDVRLDYHGKVYSSEVVKGAKNYGIYLGTNGATGAFKQVMLFLADGTTKTMTAMGTNVDVPVSAGKLVLYSVNDKGVVTVLKAASHDGATAVDYTGGTHAVSKANVWDGYLLASDTVIFNYSGSNPADPDNYSIVAYTKLTDSSNVHGSLFTEASIVKAALVNDGTLSNDIYAFVKGYANLGDSKTELDLIVALDDKETYKKDSALNTTDATGHMDQTLKKISVGTSGKIKTVGAHGLTGKDIKGVLTDIDGFVFTSDSKILYAKKGTTKGVFVPVQKGTKYVTWDLVNGGYKVFADPNEILDAGYKIGSMTMWDTDKNGAYDIALAKVAPKTLGKTVNGLVKTTAPTLAYTEFGKLNLSAARFTVNFSAGDPLTGLTYSDLTSLGTVTVQVNNSNVDPAEVLTTANQGQALQVTLAGVTPVSLGNLTVTAFKPEIKDTTNWGWTDSALTEQSDSGHTYANLKADIFKAVTAPATVEIKAEAANSSAALTEAGFSGVTEMGNTDELTDNTVFYVKYTNNGKSSYKKYTVNVQ